MVLLKNKCRERAPALPAVLNAGALPFPTMAISLQLRAGLFLSVCLLAGCGGQTAPQPASTSRAVASSPTPPPQVVEPPVAGPAATLEDEVRGLPDGRIAWTTYWKLCWEPYRGAREYELETMTGEGTRRRLIRQAETCLRVEVAKGENAKAQGLFNRDLMLASLSGQLAYRVRAVLGPDRVSQWSPSAIVGQSGKSASSAAPKTK